MKMKFLVDKVAKSNVRLGFIKDINRLPECTLETPLLLIHTKGGSIPHISYEVLKHLTHETVPIMVTIPSTIQCFDSLIGFKEGISKYIGLEECFTFCSAQDPGSFTPEGYNTKNEISLWSYSGRVPLTAQKYMKMIETYRPDMYEVLYDGDVNCETSQKRLKKSIDVSENFLEECLDFHKKSEVLNNIGIIANLQGGFSLDLRKRATKFAAEQQVTGFSFGGLINGQNYHEAFKFSEAKMMIQETLKFLPDDKLRIVSGCWKPHHIIELVELGLDVFDSSLAFALTEKNCAFTFSFKSIPHNEDDVWSSRSSSNSDSICLMDGEHSESFKPILEGCSCLTCTKHTRAYIHHLVCVKELLAPALLMIHNLHHYMQFFKFIREAAHKDEKVVIV